jgi:hypothetical protein
MTVFTKLRMDNEKQKYEIAELQRKNKTKLMYNFLKT